MKDKKWIEDRNLQRVNIFLILSSLTEKQEQGGEAY